MDAPGASFYLWSPWRSAVLEHKLFDAVSATPHAIIERLPDELRLDITDARRPGSTCTSPNVERVLKGWQEEGRGSREREAVLALGCSEGGHRRERLRSQRRAVRVLALPAARPSTMAAPASRTKAKTWT